MYVIALTSADVFRRGHHVLPAGVWRLAWLLVIAGFVWAILARRRRLRRGLKAQYYRLVPYGKRAETLEDSKTLAHLGSLNSRLESTITSTPSFTYLVLKPRPVEGRQAPVEHYLATTAKEPAIVAEKLAAAWGWRAEPIAAPPAEIAEVLATSGIKIRQAVVRSTQPITPAGSYLGAFSEVLDEDLQRTGRPAVIAVTFEPARQWEVGRLTREFTIAERQGHVPTVGSNVGTMNARAANDQGFKATVMVAADMSEVTALVGNFQSGPVGNAQRIASRIVSNIALALPAASVAGTAAALDIGGFMTAGGPGLFAAALKYSVFTVGVVCAGVMTGGRYARRQLEDMTLVVERPLRFGPRVIGLGLASKVRDGDLTTRGKQTNQFHVRPWSPRTLFFNPEQVASIGLVPGDMSHAAAAGETQRHAAHYAFTETKNGSRVGWDRAGHAVRIPDVDRYRGVVYFGNPGTGKTTAVLQLLADDLYRRLGGHVTSGLQLIDVKGDTTVRAARMLDDMGYRPGDYYVINVADPNSPVRLELFDRDLDPRRAAEALVDAMQYAFDDGAIQSQSRDILLLAFRVAYGIPRHLYDVLWGGAVPDVMYVAELLLGVRGDAIAKELLDNLEQLMNEPTLDSATAADPYAEANAAPAADEDEPGGFLADGYAGDTHNSSDDSPDYSTQYRKSLAAYSTITTTPLADAIRDIRYWWTRPERERTNAFAAPRNKVTALRNIEGLWGDRNGDKREAILLPELVRSGAVVLVNFGSPGPGIPGPNDHTASLLASMFLFADWHAIQAQCSDWYETNRSTVIATDELGAVCGVGDGATDLISAMLDTGRSRGVRLVVATQRPSQLPEKVANAVLNAGFRAWFAFEQPDVCEQAAKDLCGAGDDPDAYDSDDIRKLRRGECVVRGRAGDVPVPPFTLFVPATDWTDQASDTPPQELADRAGISTLDDTGYNSRVPLRRTMAPIVKARENTNPTREQRGGHDKGDTAFDARNDRIDDADRRATGTENRSAWLP